LCLAVRSLKANSVQDMERNRGLLMYVFIPAERDPEETRIPLIVEDVAKLIELGAAVHVESGLGRSIGCEDAAYEKAGAVISSDRIGAMQAADMVLRMSCPTPDEITELKEGSIHVSYMDPFNNAEVVEAFAARGVSAISLEMIPRTTIAQKMDVLSSQANLAGYAAVVTAAERLGKILPMMMTPAGTLSPARFFIIGAGVAGLQAIATAKRLGARVEAFDVRPEAQEQIASLGAKAVKIDLGETGKTKDGYAKKLTDEQVQKQRDAMAKHCGQADVVITTAQVFGRRAPLIVTNAMLDAMQPGGVVVDLAVSTGGNVEASECGRDVDRAGVTILGTPELSRQFPVDASQMFSSNLYHFVNHFWDKIDSDATLQGRADVQARTNVNGGGIKETGAFNLDREDEIIQGCLISHGGEIVNARIREALNKEDLA
jgi:H+-translocating NAD(P) transhydrogenase subunit alpha